MARTLPINAQIVIPLDGSGNGQGSVGPVNPREVWYPTAVSVSCSLASPSGSTPRCFIYAGAGPYQQYFVDGTYALQAAASSLISGQVLYPGNQIWAVITGGPTTGAQVVIGIQGTRSTS